MEERKKELEQILSDYPITLSTVDVANIINCHPRTAWKKQREGVIKSFIIDYGVKNKTRKTLKADLIDNILKKEERSEK